MSTRAWDVTVVGAGLAGCEAAYQLAERGLTVRLVEMKPARRTPAQATDRLAELVCSNSLRSNNPNNAVGLLKEEAFRLGSLVLRAAYEARVPAGDALAVDRTQFATFIESALHGHPRIRMESRVVTTLPDAVDGPCIIATGPLTADELAHDLVRVTGHERLYFYDALAPIVAGDSIDTTVAFSASRWGKGEGSDYLNCPLDKPQYLAFVEALLTAEHMPHHAFEEPKYFSGCQPIEVIAASGVDALRYGPMKPVGLDDPRTGRWPYAVVQLRREDKAGQAWNLVGFQTKLKWPEQQRIFRTLPGLERAEFLRLGVMHRNTYLDSPALLDERMRLTTRPHLSFAGQITGVEGYVESAAHGLLTALLLASDLRLTPLEPPPATTALGALYRHVRGLDRLPGRPHEPQNVNWGMTPPLDERVRKRDAKAARLARARHAFEQWAATQQLALHAAPAPSVLAEPASTDSAQSTTQVGTP